MKWEDRKFTHERPETIPGLVSIVLPTYNRPEFLKSRIKEIIDQEYTDWELIVVNDGGLDVSALLPEQPNIKYINLKTNSQSVSIPRNIGISYAKGEFICPSDDDVVLSCKKLKLLVKNIGDRPLCYGNRTEYHTSTNNIKQAEMIYDWNPLVGSGVDNGQFIYRKNCYEQMPYIISTHACDYHLAKEIYKLYGSFSYVNNVVCQYIWHENNRTYQEGRKKVPLKVELFKEYFNVHNEIKIIREV